MDSFRQPLEQRGSNTSFAWSASTSRNSVPPGWRGDPRLPEPPPNKGSVQAAGFFDLKCIGLIAAAVGGALIPASKVVKIAKIVKKYGVKRVMNAIKGVRKGKGQSLSGDLKNAALILLGVDEIKDACT